MKVNSNISLIIFYVIFFERKETHNDRNDVNVRQ